MATLYEVNGVWAVKYLWAGKRYTRSLKTRDRKKAQKLKAELEVALVRKREEVIDEDVRGYVGSVESLADRYLVHAASYHRGGRKDVVRTVIQALVKHSGGTRPAEFGPKRLKSLRDTWVHAGHKRHTCNDYTAIVKAMFAWGVEEELIPESVYRPLQCVQGLRKGRTDAPESEPRQIISRELIFKTLDHLPRTLKAMVLLQYWTGARPGEIFDLTPKDIDRSRDVWVATVMAHKGSWREGSKPRYLAIPEGAQASLRELILETAPGEPLFRPLRAMQERWDQCPTHRKVQSQGTCGHIGDTYDKDSYRRAIKRACEKAGIPTWTPYQLRHTAATEIAMQIGGMAAKAMLGHASLNTTQIYLHADLEVAIEAARNRR